MAGARPSGTQPVDAACGAWVGSACGLKVDLYMVAVAVAGAVVSMGRVTVRRPDWWLCCVAGVVCAACEVVCVAGDVPIVIGIVIGMLGNDDERVPVGLHGSSGGSCQCGHGDQSSRGARARGQRGYRGQQASAADSAAARTR